MTTLRALRRLDAGLPSVLAVIPIMLFGILGVGVSSARAEVAAPGWVVSSRSYPTNLSPGGRGQISISLYDVGAADSTGSVTVSDTLPEGVVWTGAQPTDEQWHCAEASTVVTCTTATDLQGVRERSVTLTEGAELRFDVEVTHGAREGKVANQVTVAGGGATSASSASNAITIGSAPVAFGFTKTEAWFSNANGTLDTQAGSHPYSFSYLFDLNTEPDPEEPEAAFQPGGGQELRNAVVNLPPGLVGNPTAVPQCTRELFDEASPACAASTQVGYDSPTILRGRLTFSVPVYNLVPPPGTTAELGFDVLGIPVFLDIVVRSGGNYGITAHVYHLPQTIITSNRLTVWGVPGDSSHDPERCALIEEHYECGRPFAGSVVPFLTLPTSCEGASNAPKFSVSGNTWGDGESVSGVEAEWPRAGFTGCNYLQFEPAITVSPDTGDADTPAGLTTEVKIPQPGLVQPEGLATASLRDAVVELPEGLVINPGRATGLQACSLPQAGVHSGEAVGDEGPPSCPAASQIGTVEVTTPLLPDKLEGDVYLLQSEPPDIKVLLAPSGDGVNVKVVGDVSLDPVTGRLTTTFAEAPPVPFTDFKVSFSGGAQAALATPTECGVYTSTTDFTPWSSPFVPDVFSEDSFGIASGTGGSPCASPLPFGPTMIAGATTDQAGGYTDFSLLLQRADDQQRVSRLQFKTPAGLLGMISHVSLCEGPQAASGECPAGSQIGHTTVGAGPGPYPLYVPEPGEPEAPIYITGPYEGAPYGLSIVVPVIAGPFNLGTTVVRGRIEVDPLTSQLTITTDPLPTILDGVPVDMRTINAVIDRKEFMFNPTNCTPQTFSGTATSTEGTTAALSSPFQVGSCRGLAFKPTFKVSTSAKTSRTQGASLHVSLTLPDEGGLSSIANVQKVKVSLPKQLPSPLKTLQKACLEKAFAENPKSCPLASQVGQVKVSTPVLPGGLSGTAYFVSHGGAKYPELILVLTGQNGVTVQVHGETFISKRGITTATFATVPDVPFLSFELELPEREYPALTANGNLCKGTLIMPTEITGQNGLLIRQSTKIAVTGCRKTAHKKAARKRKTKRSQKRKKR